MDQAAGAIPPGRPVDEVMTGIASGQTAVVRDGLRGLALGALAVALLCAAFSAQNLHTGLRAADWLIGWLMLAVPLVALVALLRIAAAIPALLLRSRFPRGHRARDRRRPGRVGPARRRRTGTAVTADEALEDRWPR